RRKLAERTEASTQVSEFNVSCKGAGEKLVLSELLQPIRPKSALSTVKKELTKVKQKKAVELPLSKEEAERVVREAAYVRTSKDVGRWQQVVLQNRRAEQLVFPLKQEIATVVPLEQVVSAWKARTPLEQEIFGLLHKTKQPITDPLLTPEETASLQAMSLEEARQRRAELQKARVVQSYYEAKARREKKIKSKKYHRVLKKSKRRKALKEFELLHKSDPEAALAKLEELEQLRMQERMSLKHQNKGKWARSRAIMAKYDLEARKAMQEQLARNKELTQKVRVELPEEEPSDVPEEDLTSETVPTIPVGASGANPWMLGKPSGPAEELKVQEGLENVAVPDAVESKEEMEKDDDEEDMSEEEALLQDFMQKRQVRQQQARSLEEQGGELIAQESVCMVCCRVGQRQGGSWELFSAQFHIEGGIDQRGVITEAFAGDDVVADFTREKRKAEEAAKPQPVNLVLPGWGEWGGTGLKPSARKIKRFLLKPPPAPPRKDQHLPHVIMSERRNIHAAAHQVSELPFPFERHQQFEQSIRTPVGATWNTQRAFQKLTTPRIITRSGHIIKPLSAEDVPDMATTAGTGAKPALEIVPQRPEPPLCRRRRRAR
uniref:UTP14A small subunit processome component n=1 Tax=Athene cunicularia TaxID=194338 RepID=A0A663MBT1_ATHCN